MTTPEPDAPAPLRKEPPRGRYGWYKLPHPQTGEVDIWPRVSTIARTLADEYGLVQWKLRMAVAGLARRSDLIASAAAADPQTDKSTLDNIVTSALERAESGAAANWGNAMHKFAQRLDAGEAIDKMNVPDRLKPDLEAYRAALKAHGYTVLPEYSERVIVNEVAGYAGQWDRVVRDRKGNHYVLDLKTGADLSYSWFEFTTQLALYSRGRYLCSLDYGSYETMPALDMHKGLVLHLPLGSAKGEIYGVNIERGWVAAQTAMTARALRTESKEWAWLVQPESPADVVALHIDRAETLEALQGVAANATQRGIWTDELAARAWARSDVIRARVAVDRATLAALYEELTPAGRWSAAVSEAAQRRATELELTTV